MSPVEPKEREGHAIWETKPTAASTYLANFLRTWLGNLVTEGWRSKTDRTLKVASSGVRLISLIPLGTRNLLFALPAVSGLNLEVLQATRGKSRALAVGLVDRMTSKESEKGFHWGLRVCEDVYPSTVIGSPRDAWNDLDGIYDWYPNTT